MKKILVFIPLCFFSITTFAWNHSVDFGYGISHDKNYTRYNNSGFLLSSDLFPIGRTQMTFWTLNGALGQWYTTTKDHKYETTAALSVAMRLYPFKFKENYPAYILGTVGPAYITNRQFGRNKQAKNVTFQFNMGLGVEMKKFDLNLRLVHFSNAYLAKPDQGYTIYYLLSIGYLFN